MRKALWRLLVPVLAAALLLGGLIVLGRSARDALRGHDRYALPFAAIDCAPPPGTDRAAFLSEVQYLGEQPERLDLLDEGLAGRLAAAFARHPWVEKVEGVEVLPARQVRVRLVYRTPVLVVRSPVGQDWQERVVDGHAVVLPPGRLRTDELPVLKVDTISLPTGPTGTPWDDRRVKAAARTAAYLHPYQDRLHLRSIEVGDDGLVLGNSPAAVVRWGHPPGEETDDEAPAARKLERLLEYCTKHGGLGTEKEPGMLDVRRR
jgi:hypothetical protein